MSRLSAAAFCEPRRELLGRHRLVVEEEPCRPHRPTRLTNFGVSVGWPASVRGRSSLIELAISGAVMMKITSSTSITSTSGVTLMSDSGRCPPAPIARPPVALLPREVRPKAMQPA